MSERDELQKYERIVDVKMKDFVEVGSALMAIQEKRLYRETHKTFDKYCEDRFGVSRQHAYSLMAASDCHRNLSDISDKTAKILPRNHAQAKAIVDVADDKEQQQQVWIEVVKKAGDKPITAKMIEDVADEILPPKTDKKPKPAPVEPVERKSQFNPEDFEPQEPVDDKAAEKIDGSFAAIDVSLNAAKSSMERAMNAVDSYHAKSPVTTHKAVVSHYQAAFDGVVKALESLGKMAGSWRNRG